MFNTFFHASLCHYNWKKVKAVKLSVALLPDFHFAGVARKFYKLGKFIESIVYV